MLFLSTCFISFTLLLTGMLTLTAQYWAKPTHTWDGTNWAATFLVTSCWGWNRF